MVKILWVDDEVELLKPHVLFLKQKGYEVDTCNNGYDAIDMAAEGAYDLIILDEMMPGMTGLETLPKIKEVRPTTPVIMVTKSEEENIMDKAVGSKIADYLIKPVNPNQVLLSIKKNVHQQQLVTEQTTADYRSEFGRISSSLQMAETFSDWCSLYRKLTNWEVELSESTDQGIKEVLTYQKTEANQEFCKFVRRNYYNWINKRSDDTPVMSHTLMRTNIFPVVDETGRVVGCATRGECHDGRRLLHPVVHLHLFNSRGELYLQKRPLWKDIQPGRWDTAVGGHVDYGETPDEALRREVREELGVTEFTPERLTQYIFDSVRERELVYVNRTVYDGPVTPSDETDGGRFWTIGEILRTLGTGLFTPNFESEFRRVFLTDDGIA